MTATPVAPSLSSGSSSRIVSVDGVRGLVMFTMIFVNDISGVPDRIIPAWMKHFHGRSGMTFVDLVFPAFLFIVGMSIPFALGSRLTKGEPLWRIVLHIITRTLTLLLIGTLMVNESPDSEVMGWSASLWSTLMFLSAILAVCTISPRSAGTDEGELRTWRYVSLALRGFGFAGLAWLAFAFRGGNNQRIITLSPFSINTEWYGILGLIGWAYLVASMVFLIFRGHRTAILGCTALLLCLYPADRAGAFENFWLAHYVGIGETLGSQASITAAGMLLASILLAPDTTTVRSRIRFTLLFISGFAAAALLLDRPYGISKNNATPSWCLWSDAITASLWLVFYVICDIRPAGFIPRLFFITGQNVLLAYLLSEMLPGVLNLFHVGSWYAHLAEPNLACAIARSSGCATVILMATAVVNRFGFRLRL